MNNKIPEGKMLSGIFCSKKPFPGIKREGLFV